VKKEKDIDKDKEIKVKVLKKVIVKEV
jgi:hypothetical protein